MAAALLATACTGDQGPTGPAGPQGNDGTDGTPAPATTQPVAGSVVMPGGASNASVVVQAILLDLDGGEAATVGATVTDGSGDFTVEVPASLPLGLQILLRAVGSSGDLDAFALSAATDIGAATNGVATLVRQIVAQSGGTNLNGFDAAAIATAVTAAAAALVTAGTDTSDPDAVFEEVLDAVGTDVAAASGAMVTAGPQSPLVTTDPPGVDTPIASFNFSLFDALGEDWDVTTDGSIGDGSSDAYDDMFDLFIDSVAITVDTTFLRDDRTVVVEGTGGGLDIVRKVYVPETQSWVRYTEVLTNPGATDVTVSVQIEGNTGSDESINLAHATSSGDTEVGPGDHWLTSHFDLSDPALGFIFPEATNAIKEGDDIDYYWDDVVVAAGETLTIFHWGFQRTADGVEVLTDEISAIGSVPGADLYEISTIADATNGFNGGSLASLRGDAGAAVPGETLTIGNTTQTTSAEATAGSDGSFASRLSVETGDQIQITGDRGTDITLIVP